MLYLLPVIVPLLALWLWHPLLATPVGRAAMRYREAGSARSQRHLFWWCFVLTVVCGTSPAWLIWLLRNAVMSYSLIAPMQLASGVVFGAVAMALVAALVRDVAGLVVWLLAGAKAARAVLWRPGVTVALAVLAMGTSLYGVLQGLKVPQVREHTVTLPTLPPALDGLRVAVLADLHASPVNDAARQQAIVERTNAARPDIIVLPGDLVDGDAATQSGHIAPLAGLRAPLGVWAAPGNHEYYSGYDEWGQVYRQFGLRYLENEAQVLQVRGQRLAVSGVGDPAYFQTTGRAAGQPAQGVPPEIEAVVRQARAGGAQFHLMLGHQPRLARAAAALGVDLQIAGHTHGGHILGMDRWLVAPANDGFVRGFYTVHPTAQTDAQAGGAGEWAVGHLFVSSGAGLWVGFAHRLGVPSAIDVLVLRSQAAAAPQAASVTVPQQASAEVPVAPSLDPVSAPPASGQPASVADLAPAAPVPAPPASPVSSPEGPGQ